MTKRTTLADIARACDVSVATVSMVLRNQAASIPPDTRNRIRATARILDYTPRPSREPAVSTLGVLVKGKGEQPMRDNPFYAGILAGIEDTCRHRHIDLLYSAIPVDGDNCPIEYPRLLSNSTLGGLMVVGVWVTDRLQRMLEELGAPVVLVDGYAASNGYEAVVSDNRHGAHHAVSHLIAHGHRHIAMVIADSGHYPSISERQLGYLDALHEGGLTDSYIIDCTRAPHTLEEEVGRLLREHPQITAIFGGNDLTALSAAGAARALGRRLPEELSLVGFDDISIAQQFWPPLTTMHVDTRGMGRMAVQLLLNRLEYPQAEMVTAVMRPRLIERQSVVAPPLMAIADDLPPLPVGEGRGEG